MRKYRISYFFGQAFKGLWRNRMMSLASISVLLSCIVVMGSFVMLLVNIRSNLDSLGDLNEIFTFADVDEPYSNGDKAVLAPTVSSEGRSFLGWSTDPDAESADYSAGGEYTVSSADAVNGVIKMYAVWSERSENGKIGIKYDASGLAIDGTVPVTPDKYNAGQSITLADGLTARYGTIEFLGWSLVPGAATAAFSAGDAYSVNAADANGGVVTFYAVWSEMPSFSTYSIVYDLNGVEGNAPTDNETRLMKIKNKLSELEGIEKDGIKFISKEETLEKEKENLKDYPSLIGTLESGNNPYPDTFVITYSDSAHVSSLQLQLERIEGIYKVRFRSDLAEGIESLKNGIILVFVWFLVILAVVSICVIINTIKLAVAYRSQELEIMKYIGATKGFASAPFLIEGMLIGVISGAIAYLIQWYIYGYVQNMVSTDIQMITVIPFGELKMFLLAGCIVVGIIAGLLGSYISTRKYIKV